MGHTCRRTLTIAGLLISAALGALAANHLSAVQPDNPGDWRPNIRHIVDHDNSPVAPPTPSPAPPGEGGSDGEVTA